MEMFTIKHKFWQIYPSLIYQIIIIHFQNRIEQDNTNSHIFEFLHSTIKKQQVKNKSQKLMNSQTNSRVSLSGKNLKISKSRNRVTPHYAKKSLIFNTSIDNNKSQTSHNIISQNQFSSLDETTSRASFNQNLTISAIRRKHLLIQFIKKIIYLIAPNEAPPHVHENWEQQLQAMNQKQQSSNQQQNFDLQSFQNQLGFRYSNWKIIQFVQGIIIVALFWMASIQLVFLHKNNDYSPKQYYLFPQQMKNVLAVFTILKIIVKQSIAFLLPPQQEDYTIQTFKDIVKPIIYMLNCILYISLDYVLGVVEERYILQAICTLIFLERIMNISVNFQAITNYFQSKNLKNQFRIIKLFFFSMTLCHFFALVMYSMTYIYPHGNWLTSLHQKLDGYHSTNENSEIPLWVKDYIYSMYWAITTMVTVGYGDITPTRFYQIAIVSFVQLIGTAMFGYMINVIGIAVAEINKKNEEFDNYITTINKLEAQYQISRRLCQKFKNQIAHYQQIKRQTPLSSKEESQFFKLITPTLKDSFILQTNIRVIKKSIFFLTYFTVNFQNQIALKLIRRIYKKGEKINIMQETPMIQSKQSHMNKNRQYNEANGINKSVTNGQPYEYNYVRQQNTYNVLPPTKNSSNSSSMMKQRAIAIINYGSTAIQILNQNNNMEIKKYIKTISPQQGKPTLNVFGYSSVILNKDINLSATAQENSVVYLLKRKDILECLDKNMLDFEGVAEIKQKMLQYRNINQIQGPSIRDITAHYLPNIYFVYLKRKTIVQKRGQFKRTSRRNKIKIISLHNYQNRTLMCIDLDETSKEIPLRPSISEIDACNRYNKDYQKNYLTTKNNLNVTFNNVYIPHNPNCLQEQSDGSFEGAQIDSMKNFENFMKKHNFNRVVTLYHEYLSKMRKSQKHVSMINNFKSFRQKFQKIKEEDYTNSHKKQHNINRQNNQQSSIQQNKCKTKSFSWHPSFGFQQQKKDQVKKPAQDYVKQSQPSQQQI